MAKKIPSKKWAVETMAVHAGREDFLDLGVHAPPIDLSTTYPLKNLDSGIASIDALVEGERSAENPIYARLYNPTVARFEEALAILEGADDAVAFGSGMAALSACLMVAREEGGHVVAVRPLYGGSDHLIDSGLLGLEVSWTTPDAIIEAVRPDTSLIIVETPANPTLNLTDIRTVVAQAGEVPVLVDSTFATPILQKPLDRGAAYVLHSATKFLGGHGDVIAGVIATNTTRAKRLRKIRIVTGGLLHPISGYLLHRGLTTLSIRVKQAQTTAIGLAGRLLEHNDVERVYYPGLSHCDPLCLVGDQMCGPGTMVAFEVKGGYDVASRTMRLVQLLTPAVSLGSVDTLIQHPAGLTHRVVAEAARVAHGISDGLLRVSVGLEDLDDLWEDLSSALRSAHQERTRRAPEPHTLLMI